MRVDLLYCLLIQMLISSRNSCRHTKKLFFQVSVNIVNLTHKTNHHNTGNSFRIVNPQLCGKQLHNLDYSDYLEFFLLVLQNLIISKITWSVWYSHIAFSEVVPAICITLVLYCPILQSQFVDQFTFWKISWLLSLLVTMSKVVINICV